MREGRRGRCARVARASTTAEAAMTRVRLKTPQGQYIIGTLEQLQGCAFASTFEVLPDGSLSPEHEYETEIWWEAQETVKEDGVRICVDRDLGLWRETELIRVPVEDG